MIRQALPFLIIFTLLATYGLGQHVEVAVQARHQNSPTDAVFSHDNKFFYTVGIDNALKMWEVKTGLLVKTIPIPVSTNGLYQVTVSADNQVALVCGYGGYLIDIQKGTVIEKISTDLYNTVLLPDGKRYINGGTLSCADVASGKVLWWHGRSNNHHRVAISGDGKYFLTKGFGESIAELFESETGKLAKVFKCAKDKPGGNSLTDMGFSHDGRKVFLLYTNGLIQIFDVSIGKSLYNRKPGKDTYAAKGCFTFDDLFLYSARGYIHLLDWKNNTELNKFGRHMDKAMVASSATQPLFMSVSGSFNAGDMYLWNYKSGVKLRDVGKSMKNISDVEFSKDETLIGGRFNSQNAFVINRSNLWKVSAHSKPSSMFSKYTIDKGEIQYNGKDEKINARISQNGIDVVGADMDLIITKPGSNRVVFKDATNFVINHMLFDAQGNLMVSSGFYETVVYNLKTMKSIAMLDGAHVLDLSPDKQFLAINNQTNLIIREPFPPYKTLKTINAHSTKISSISFAKNALVTAADDGVIKLWSVPDFSLLATCFVLDNERRIIVTPDGYYMGDRNISSQEIAFNVGERTYPIDQFDLKFNRPDVVLSRLGGATPDLIAAYEKAYSKRLKKMGLRDDMLSSDFHLPEVSVDHLPPALVQTKSINLEIKAWDQLYNIDRINIYVNNVPVYGSRGLSVNKEKEVSVNAIVELTQGTNFIQVSAMNDRGGESLRESFNVTYEGPQLKPALYVVSIGVSDFQNADYNLTYASKDAADVISLFKSDVGKSRYSRIEEFSFLNSQATKENILKVKEVLSRSKVDDEVIVFVATHGLLDDDLNYYLATHDVNFNSPAQRGLLYEDLESILDGIPARRKWMLLDACHSGEVDKEDSEVVASAQSPLPGVKSRGFKSVKSKETKIGLKNSFELMQELFVDFRKGTGAIVISSASGSEYAFESSEWKNGVFTYALLEGLSSRKADLDEDTNIRITELKKYVIKRVVELTNGKQHPTSRTENLENDFIVW